ncbi:MAG: DNA recombination protein RmuC [Nitrospira sp. CG24B]|nr:MAG: DNA recombination protein RmuC [Nitrospira sp. CG24B]
MSALQPRQHKYSDGWPPISYEVVLAVLLICILFPSALFAQAANQPVGMPKEETIDKLKERLQQMEEQHQKELTELKDRLGLVEKQQSSLSDQFAQNIKVGAYGAVAFESFKDRRTTYDGNLELLISGNIHDRIRIYSEIDLGLPRGTAEAEQAYVDLLLTQPFNIRAGILLVPFGKFNLDHFDPRRDLTRPPSVARLVTPTTWGDLGFGAFGFLPISENVKATYDIQVINGLTDKFIAVPGNIPDPGLQSARTGLNPDNNGDKAIVGRGTLKFFDQYEIGLSGYRGDYKTGSQDLITGIAFDTEFRPRNITILENFVLRSEFARFDIQGTTTPSSLWGYYLQLTYRFWPSSLNSTILGRHFNNPTFALVGLYGRTKINTTASPTGSQTGEQMIIGFNYRPVEDYVFKAEYQFNNGEFNQIASDGFLTSIAWIF